jgi:hypothetical protein
MRGILTVLALALALLLGLSYHVAQLTPEQEQEFTELVLSSVSGQCREEIVTSMNNNRNDLSEECRLEIQAFTQQHQEYLQGKGAKPQSSDEGIETGLYDDFGQPIYSKKKTAKVVKPSWIHPITAIVIVFVSLLGALVAYLVHYFQTVGFDEPKKPKKLSKKKVSLS